LRTVPYDRQTINSPNPLARFAHRIRAGKSVAIAEKLLPRNGVVVDFGAGTGLFLSQLGDRRPDVALTAIEPFMPPSADPRIAYASSLGSFDGTADVVTAFEVCEHLSDAQIDQFLSDAMRTLGANGKLIVSVPIMVGAALPFKELNRLFLFRRISDYSPAELMSGTFGGIVDRSHDRLTSHKGFDFRWLRGKLSEHFVVESEIFSPLPLPWWANSQAFFICHKA
jgi:hypothetical protein